jgi:hypothetical protein
MAKKDKGTFNNVISALAATVKSLYSLAPAAVLAGILLFWLLMNATIQLSDTTIMSVVILIIILTSLLISLKYRLTGEALLGLTAGLLTAFTVSWSMNRFVLFMIAWFAFFGFTTLFWSIKMAADLEQIIRQSSIWIDNYNVEMNESKLNVIIKNSNLQYLDRVSAAKALRILIFRKLPLEISGKTLKSIEMFSSVTGVNFMEITIFYADLYRILNDKQKAAFFTQIDLIFNALRSIPASPDDFLISFRSSFSLIRNNNLDVGLYLYLIEAGFENGVAPDEMHDYIKSVSESKKQSLDRVSKKIN